MRIISFHFYPASWEYRQFKGKTVRLRPCDEHEGVKPISEKGAKEMRKKTKKTIRLEEKAALAPHMQKLNPIHHPATPCKGN
jgi:hypothetical protein